MLSSGCESERAACKATICSMTDSRHVSLSCTCSGCSSFLLDLAADLVVAGDAGGRTVFLPFVGGMFGIEVNKCDITRVDL